jgi:hypothetical protein
MSNGSREQLHFSKTSLDGIRAISKRSSGFDGPVKVSFFVHALNIESETEYQHQTAYLEHLEAAKGLLRAARHELEQKGLQAVYQGKNTAPESSTLVKVVALTERKLRKIMREAPKNEREVQNAIETLFVAADIEHAREIDRFEYSSKSYIPDFTLSKIDLAVEIKICNRADREKEIIAEINDDILAYKQKYGNILFVIYDLGFIRDVEKFKEHFEQQDQVLVQVIKH